jgi:hypothetical protein
MVAQNQGIDTWIVKKVTALIFPAEIAMSRAVALLTGLPGGSFSCFAQLADFELELEEAVIPLARERAGGERFEDRTLRLLRMGAVAEVAA